MNIVKADDVAQYFINYSVKDEAEGFISNIKLQKLLFLSQGFHLAIFSSRLFNEYFYPWILGPAIPDLFNKYNRYDNGIITNIEYISYDKFSKRQALFLDHIWSQFGQYAAWKLTDLFNENSAYRRFYHMDMPITMDFMLKYFKKEEELFGMDFELYRNN